MKIENETKKVDALCTFEFAIQIDFEIFAFVTREKKTPTLNSLT